MIGLLDHYAARKRKQQKSAEKEADQAEASNRPSTDGGLETQAIVIPSSPEMGSSDQLGPEGAVLGSEGKSL